MTGAFHSVGKTYVHRPRMGACLCVFEWIVAAWQISFSFWFHVFLTIIPNIWNWLTQTFQNPCRKVGKGVYFLPIWQPLRVLSQPAAGCHRDAVIAAAHTSSFLIILFYLMELDKLQHKLSVILYENYMGDLYLLPLNVSSSVLWSPLGLWEKQKIGIALPTDGLSSPPILTVPVPWLFFLTWRPSHSGFSAVCKVRKLACLKLTGEFRSGLPYLETISLGKEIAFAYSSRKMQTIFVKITVVCVNPERLWQALAVNFTSWSSTPLYKTEKSPF